MNHSVEIIAVLQLVNEGFVGIQGEGGCVVRRATSGRKSLEPSFVFSQTGFRMDLKNSCS